METDLSGCQSFRFRRNLSETSVYVATRQGLNWSVMLEGHTEPWMYWVVGEEYVQNFWDLRLTD